MSKLNIVGLKKEETKYIHTVLTVLMYVVIPTCNSTCRHHPIRGPAEQLRTATGRGGQGTSGTIGSEGRLGARRHVASLQGPTPEPQTE